MKYYSLVHGRRIHPLNSSIHEVPAECVKILKAVLTEQTLCPTASWELEARPVSPVAPWDGP